MSGLKCKSCGSTDIDADPSRGDVVCTECGFVLEDELIVSDNTFEEAPAGNMIVLGQFVASDSTGGATGFGGTYHINGKESRRITLQNAKKGITHLCLQLQLNQHHIETSVNFYKMALNQQLTRGRKQAHNHAACVYITCRTAGTAHMLIDISDVLQICVHELGRTYLKFTQALCINIPSVDPCLYIMRFAHKLEFGDKTNDVYMTAIRIVQRMKRDSIHSGRRPSGLCGAALLMAARLHDFNRSPADIIKIVKVHESTLRKRLIEFGDTPSSALTLEEFTTVDLEEEQDPPAFKAARKKDRERLQKLENIDNAISELQAEIDKQLDEKTGKSKKSKGNLIKDQDSVEVEDADRFIRESNLNIINNCIRPDDPDDPDDPDNPDSIDNSNDPISCNIKKSNSPLVTGLGPDIVSMGLAGPSERSTGVEENVTFGTESGEIDLNDIDDNEIDSYIVSEEEANYKASWWNDINADYLQEQKVKEEKRQREKDEGKPEKKRRRTTKKNKSHTPANSAGEAIEKMLQEKRISTKINYDVLKTLNVGLPTNNNQQQQTNSETTLNITPKVENNLSTNSITTSSPPKSRERPTIRTIKKIQPRIEPRKVEFNTKINEPNIPEEDNEDTTRLSELNTSDLVDETDDYIDEDVDGDANEMSVGHLLGHRTTTDYDDEHGYEYDDEEEVY